MSRARGCCRRVSRDDVVRLSVRALSSGDRRVSQCRRASGSERVVLGERGRRVVRKY